MYYKLLAFVGVSVLALALLVPLDIVNAQAKKSNTNKRSSKQATKAKDSNTSTTTSKGRGNNLIIERQIKYKKGDKTEYDFDAADISGNFKTPLGSLVDSLNSDKDYDFIKIRLKWTPEMVQSASSLETGRGDR